MDESRIYKLELEVERLKDWIQMWIINKEPEEWRELMEKELYEKQVRDFKPPRTGAKKMKTYKLEFGKDYGRM